MLNLELIGKKIALQRKQKDLTQSNLADALFVTPQAVSKWENGKSVPSIEVLIELTTLFDITIDYLLDNSEVKDNDYSTLFKQLPREVVISRYLNSKSLDQDLNKIFYLLNLKERQLIISRIIAKRVNVSIKVLWPYLNDKERYYLLGVILSNKLKYNLSKIYHLLSTEERIICSKQIENGTYKYDLPNTFYVRS